jgi:dephospho-CoA kinase
LSKIKVGICGWAGSGKTELAKYLSEKYDGVTLSFADGIKFVNSYVFNTTKKDREKLQKIGQFFRTLDKNVWINKLLDSAEFENRVFVDDLRQRNEYDTLVENGFKIIRVVADEDIRIQRLIKRDGQCDTSLFYNDSENGCADMNLEEINNNGSFDDMYAQIELLMEKWGFSKST